MIALLGDVFDGFVDALNTDAVRGAGVRAVLAQVIVAAVAGVADGVVFVDFAITVIIHEIAEFGDILCRLVDALDVGAIVHAGEGAIGAEVGVV